MKRFTQYLYEYQKEKRIRNIGFVKISQGETSCVLQIQGRGFLVKNDEELKIYLFYKNGEEYEAVYQGDIPKKKPIINFMLEFTKEDIGNAETLDAILGIMLLEPSGRRYAAVWDGKAVNVDEISTEMRKKEEIQMPSEELGIVEEAVLPEEHEQVEEIVEVKEPELVEEAEYTEKPVLQIQVEEQKDIYEKIQRRDLARLPRREWRLANNNFLLHGFYNYHHLLWIEENGELYIGVPGINHAREVQAAQAFGFSQFRHLEDMKLDLSEGETNSREDFGYFCRRIKRNE